MTPTGQGALSGLRVLDCSRFIAGPYCGMLLGDLGADVVKVERPQGGDEARSFGPAIAGETLYVMVYNRNKRSVTIDFRHAEGPALLRDLAARADVLIENFRPGVMEAMGCDWTRLQALNPRLIMARVSGFGQDGPLAERPGLDVIGQAMGGLMHLTGPSDAPPTMAGVYVVDCATALYTTIGILAALERRHATGLGQLVDTSLLDSAVSLLPTAILEQLTLGGAAGRQGNRDRYAAPSNSFRARDGAWVHVVAGSQALFVRLATVMGRPDLLEHPDSATQEARVKHVGAVEQITADWVAGHTADEVVDLLGQAGVPAARVASIAEVADNPQLRHRGRIVNVNHPRYLSRICRSSGPRSTRLVCAAASREGGGNARFTTPERRGEGQTPREETVDMFVSYFLIAAIVLFVAWVLGWIVFHVAGGLLHVLLVIAVISLIVHFVRGRP